MRWRLVDHIDAFERWGRISGRKTVSLEEYSLLEPFGRRGSFPESLILESCVELVRWLVAASSDFALTGTPCEVGSFRFEDAVGMGQRISITATVTHRDEGALEAECGVECAGKRVACGSIRMMLTPLGEGYDTTSVKARWRELRGTT